MYFNKITNCHFLTGNVKLCAFTNDFRKTTWLNAVHKCRSIGPEWKLPVFEKEDSDTASMMSEVKQKNWLSVWTGMKRDIFDVEIARIILIVVR